MGIPVSYNEPRELLLDKRMREASPQPCAQTLLRYLNGEFRDLILSGGVYVLSAARVADNPEDLVLAAWWSGGEWCRENPLTWWYSSQWIDR